jgi:hypothetical protein
MGEGYGINASYANNGDITGLWIEDNEITYEIDARTTTWTGAAITQPELHTGMMVRSGGTVRNFSVARNKVTDAPGYGIFVGDNTATASTYAHGKIVENRVINPGRMTWYAERWFYVLNGNFDNVLMADNEAIDEQAAPTARRWLWAATSSTGTVSNTWIVRNRLRLTGAGSWNTSATNIDWTKFSREFAKMTINPASIAAGADATQTVTMTGAATSDVVTATPEGGLEAGLSFFAYVSAANTITLVIRNHTAGAVDPASRVWRFRLHRTEQDV